MVTGGLEVSGPAVSASPGLASNVPLSLVLSRQAGHLWKTLGTAYPQPWQVEKNFRMCETDLRARPIYHHKRDSIDAHGTPWWPRSPEPLAPARDRLVDPKVVHTLRRPHRSITVKTGSHILNAGTPSTIKPGP